MHCQFKKSKLCLPMRILHVIPYYKPAYVYGGPIYSSSALCEALVKKDHVVTVLTTTANGNSELTDKEEVIDNVKVLRFKRYTKNNTFLSPGIAIYLYKNIKKFDIVHIHTWWNLVSIFSLIVCSIKRKRPVFSPRGMLSDYIINTNNPSQKKVIQRLFGKSLLSKVKFHATAHSEAKEIQSIFPDANITEIFNFVNIDPLTIIPKPESEITKLIFLSRIDPKKGLEILFKALCAITWNYHLSIVGPCDENYLEKLKSLALELKISDKITWVGPVFGIKKFELLIDNDLLLLPSYNENFANIIIESLAMGTPVLISNMVGLASYIEDKNLGWVCDTNSEDIAEKLNLFKNDLPKREFINKNSPDLIKNDFDQNHLVNEYLALYVS